MNIEDAHKLLVEGVDHMIAVDEAYATTRIIDGDEDAAAKELEKVELLREIDRSSFESIMDSLKTIERKARAMPLHERVSMLIRVHSLMDEGRIVESGVPAELFENPKEARTIQFLKRIRQEGTDPEREE